MDRRVTEFARTRWKVMQWGCYALGAGFAIAMLVMHYMGNLNGLAIMSLSYCMLASLAVGFVTWYVRWYFSDSFVESVVKRGLRCRPEFVEEVIKDHPRGAEIRREIERQRGQ